MTLHDIDSCALFSQSIESLGLLHQGQECKSKPPLGSYAKSRPAQVRAISLEPTTATAATTAFAPCALASFCPGLRSCNRRLSERGFCWSNTGCCLQTRWPFHCQSHHFCDDAEAHGPGNGKITSRVDSYVQQQTLNYSTDAATFKPEAVRRFSSRHPASHMNRQKITFQHDAAQNPVPQVMRRTCTFYLSDEALSKLHSRSQPPSCRPCR